MLNAYTHTHNTHCSGFNTNFSASRSTKITDAPVLERGRLSFFCGWLRIVLVLYYTFSTFVGNNKKF